MLIQYNPSVYLIYSLLQTWVMLLIALVVLAFLISLPDWYYSREGDRRSSLNRRIQEHGWRLFAYLLCESKNGNGNTTLTRGFASLQTVKKLKIVCSKLPLKGEAFC